MTTLSTRSRLRASSTGRRHGGMRVVLVATLLFFAVPATAQQPLPTPEDHFGFTMGTADELARWDGILEYYTELAGRTDRMRVDTLGTTVLGNPYVAVWISSPENLARLDEIRAAAEALGEGRIPEAEARRIAETHPASVLIHHNIHSSEVASSQTSVQLVHDLVAAAPGSDEAEILDGVVTVLIPSGNPDGQIMITDWWREIVGTEYEESGMPFLYHHYAGHDNNRDFFQAALPETRHWMELMFERVHPQIYLDQHQMGSSGPRIFVPPYPDPMDPKIHPLQWQALQFLGGGIVADLQAAGKQGVISGEMYRIWGQEGALTGRHHNVVSLLTETASANLAGPIEVSRDRLERSRNTAAGQDPYGFSISFPDPWWGGEWTLQDIVDYQMIAAESLLLQAARFREQYLFRRWQMAHETILEAAEEGPWAYVVPLDQPDPVAATDLVRRLALQGVEVHRAAADFEAVPGVEPVPNSWAREEADAAEADAEDGDGPEEDAASDTAAQESGMDAPEPRAFSEGDWVILLGQNARAAILDLLEIQDRELVREFPGGPWRRSYDGAAYTMPLQMGVEAVRVDAPVEVELIQVDAVTPPSPGIPVAENAYLLDGGITESWRVVNALLAGEVAIERTASGDFLVPPGPSVYARLTAAHEETGLPVVADPAGVDGAPGIRGVGPVHRARIGLYQGWANSMDEGWTRLLFDDYGFDYEVLRGPDVAAGALGERFDVIVIPSQMSAREILEGNDAEDYPEEYVGGVGEAGVEALRSFVRDGGTLVALEDADAFVIEHFELPLRDALDGIPGEELFQPASIYRLELDPAHPLARGSGDEVAAKWAGGKAWAPTSWGGTGNVGRVRVVGHWPEDPERILMSGLLVGAEHLAGHAGLLDVEYGSGRIHLYGFRPQHRMQTVGTFRLLFNALVREGGRPVS